MELLLAVDAARRAQAWSITVVIPYYGYARQDRKARPRQPISARVVADLLCQSGANRVIALDLHVEQIQGFFPATVPMDHVPGDLVFVRFLHSLQA